MSWPLHVASVPSFFSFATLLVTARMIPLALTSNYTGSVIDDNAVAKELNDEEEEYTPYSDRPETYIVPFIFLLILLIGLTGNGVLALTILRHTNMRNVPNTYVLSLALGDLLARNLPRSFLRELLLRRAKQIAPPLVVVFAASRCGYRYRFERACQYIPDMPAHSIIQL